MPTPKTRVDEIDYQAIGNQLTQPEAVKSVEATLSSSRLIELDFAFNQTRLTTPQRTLLKQASADLCAAQSLPLSVRITSRADFQGRAEAKQQIALARAREIKGLVLSPIACSIKVESAVEIAPPVKVTADVAAQQRRASVLFAVRS